MPDSLVRPLYRSLDPEHKAAVVATINVEAILAARDGHTGNFLAEHYLRAIRLDIAKGVYATAEPRDQLAYENGLLRSYLRRVCDALAEVVDEPVTIKPDDFAKVSAQDWAELERREWALPC